MARKLWRLTVRDEFSAGHALRHYEGKCERLHGHNFAVELTVEGERLEPGTEILLDFKLLKLALKTTLEELDHRILNEVPPFDDINPSSENLSRHIWSRVAQLLAEHPNPQARAVRVHSVSVSEKGAQTATYMEIDA
ncbi:6-carboxytetrahydropterin synthase QueD [Desulfovibrio piger]|nr:6-carboxytetrahydropterin synthase QueD [Desulfovibrio piger]